MERRFKFLCIFGILAAYAYLVYAALHPDIPSPKNPVLFYSNQLRQDFQQTILKAVLDAKDSIGVTMYTISDPKMIRALQKKASEGKSVNVFFDSKGGSSHLPHPICSTPIKSKGLMHRKIVVIDDALVFLGSANMTRSSLLLHDNFSLGFYHKDLASALDRSNLIHFDLPGQHGELHLLPNPDTLPKLLQAISTAKTSIFASLFTFTHPALVKAFSDAKERGVAVHVAIDGFAAKGSSRKAAEALHAARIRVTTGRGPQLLHHKWALIDDDLLILGSANWTKAAFSKNEDFLLFLQPLTEPQKKYLSKLKSIIELDTAPFP